MPLTAALRALDGKRLMAGSGDAPRRPATLHISPDLADAICEVQLWYDGGSDDQWSDAGKPAPSEIVSIQPEFLTPAGVDALGTDSEHGYLLLDT